MKQIEFVGKASLDTWTPSPGDVTEEFITSTVRLFAVESVSVYIRKFPCELKTEKYQVSAQVVLAQVYEKAPLWRWMCSSDGWYLFIDVTAEASPGKDIK